MSFISVAGAGASLIGGIFKGSQARKQQRMANRIHPIDTTYQSSPYAANQLASVNQAYNGRMAGASNAEQNIQGNFADSMAGVGRNSTNSSQSLAMLAGLQGNSNQAFSNLASSEAQNKQQLLGQLGMANQGMTAEGDKVYNDQLRKYNNDVNAKNALQGASWRNKGAAVSDIGDSLIGGAAAGMFGGGGIGGLFGGGGNVPSMAQADPGNYGAPPIQNSGYIDPNYNQPQYDPYGQNGGGYNMPQFNPFIRR